MSIDNAGGRERGADDDREARTAAAAAEEFTIKDSGKRQEFSGGMVRDTCDDKIDYLNVLFGPMVDRWALHTTRGRIKYPDPEPGVPNWTLAEGKEEYLRAKASALRHMLQWLRGDRDEDHAAAVFFNINLAEYVRNKMELRDSIVVSAPPGALREDSEWSR